MAERAAQPRFVGARIARFEDDRLLSGRARFIDDITPPGTRHLAFVRAQLAHARITAIDASAAIESFPGVEVFTGDDIGDLALRANQDMPDRVDNRSTDSRGLSLGRDRHSAGGPEHEERHKKKQQQELEINGPEVQGEINPADESDLYTFRVTTTGTYTIKTSGTTDTFLSLFGPDSETTLVAVDDDGGPGTLSLLVQDLVVGQYFVRIRHFSRARTGPYGVSVRSNNIP